MSIQWDHARIAGMIGGLTNAKAGEVLVAARRRAGGRFGVEMEPMGDDRWGATIYSADAASLAAEYGDGVNAPDGWGWAALTDVAQGVGDGPG